MQQVLLNFVQLILSSIPTLVGAFLILLIGWLIALAVSAVVRRLLRRTTVDNRVAAWVAGDAAARAEVETWIGRGVFWLIMIFVLVAFFQVLGLTIITEPLNQLLVQLFQYAPRLIGAGLLLVVAWLVAGAVKYITQRALTLAKVEERFDRLAGVEEEEERVPLAKTIADAVYWLVFIIFLPAILGALAVQGLLEPVQGMINRILGYLPNLFAAGLIMAVGWLAARIVQRIVTNLLAAVGTDRLSKRIDLDRFLGEQTLSGIVGFIIYVLILIPVLIAALNALALEAITQPASNMLNLILTALPSIFAAGLLLGIAYVVGRLVASLVSNLLTGIGFNAILVRLGLTREAATGERTPSEIVGYLTLVAVMLLASIEAAQLLGFQILATLISDLTVFLGQIALGLIIFAIGLYLANLAAQVIRASAAAQAPLLALAARISILILAGAIALSQMGLASDIIRIAFGVLLAAIALAAALAFGLGGREVAGEQLKEWLEEVRSKQS
jgi:hypothetical protein